MRYWLFQGNPDSFDVRRYIEEFDDIVWSVRQKHLAPEMKSGDRVFIWLAKGSGKDSGVIAECAVVGTPAELPESPDALALWKSPPPKDEKLRVPLKVSRRCLGKKELIQSRWCEGDTILGGHKIFKLRNQTNYPLTTPEGERLARLVENTGRNWTRADSIAGLWAYSQTYGGPVSKTKGSPVVDVALRIGRAVPGVYNKVMNFRALDPRDERTGLAAGGHTDEEVWAEFYDPETKSMDTSSLDEAFSALYGEGIGSAARPEYEDFGEAPNDDPHALSLFALRVRRGQPKFRKNLIRLYDGKCAITGQGPEAVLEAAHIESHAKTGVNHTGNGLLLRSDLHTLLDAGLLRIHPESLAVVIDSKLADTPYGELNGAILRDRADGSRPAEDRLHVAYEKRMPF